MSLHPPTSSTQYTYLIYQRKIIQSKYPEHITIIDHSLQKTKDKDFLLN